MTHLQSAQETIENKNRRKHFNQKTFKKAPKTVKTTAKKNKINKAQMYKFACDWWNNWKENEFIYDMCNGWESAKTYDSKNTFLKYKYLKICVFIPNFDKVITEWFFLQQFNYCIPKYFIGWIEDEKETKKEYIHGELFSEILNYLSTKKTVKIERIYKYFDEEYEDVFESVVKGAVTRLVGLGYLKEVETNIKVFYCLNKENIEKDKKGWFKI